jgi:hypothetical protein
MQALRYRIGCAKFRKMEAAMKVRGAYSWYRYRLRERHDFREYVRLERQVEGGSNNHTGGKQISRVMID